MRRKFEFKEEVLGLAVVVALLAFQNCANPNDIQSSANAASTQTPSTRSTVWPGTRTSTNVLMIAEPTGTGAAPNSGATTCTDNNVTYGDGAQAYGDPCPGLSCTGDIGPLLTCHSGIWYYSTGMDVCTPGVPTDYADPANGLTYLRAMGCSI